MRVIAALCLVMLSAPAVAQIAPRRDYGYVPPRDAPVTYRTVREPEPSNRRLQRDQIRDAQRSGLITRREARQARRNLDRMPWEPSQYATGQRFGTPLASRSRPVGWRVSQDIRRCRPTRDACDPTRQVCCPAR